MKEALKELYWFLTYSWKQRFFSAWLLLALGIWLLSGDASTMLSAIGVLLSAISTLLLWNYRKTILVRMERMMWPPSLKFIITGGACAMWVEFIFWSLEMFTGIPLAASPNLFLDLLVTMPWYVFMMWLSWKVETRFRYSFHEILVLGGVYDLFADGLLGKILASGGLSGEVLILLLLAFPNFVLSYAFIVLPASYFLQEEIRKMQLTKVRNDYKKRNLVRKCLHGLLLLVGLFLHGLVAIMLFSEG